MAMATMQTPKVGEYTYTPPGEQAPSQEFNFSDGGSGDWMTFAPGTMSPVNMAEFNSTVNLPPNSAQQMQAMQSYITNTVGRSLSTQAQTAPPGVIGSPQPSGMAQTAQSQMGQQPQMQSQSVADPWWRQYGIPDSVFAEITTGTGQPGSPINTRYSDLAYQLMRLQQANQAHPGQYDIRAAYQNAIADQSQTGAQNAGTPFQYDPAIHPPIPNLDPLLQAWLAANPGQAQPDANTLFSWGQQNAPDLVPNIAAWLRLMQEHRDTGPGSAPYGLDANSLWEWFAQSMPGSITPPPTPSPNQEPQIANVRQWLFSTLRRLLGADANGLSNAQVADLAFEDPRFTAFRDEIAAWRAAPQEQRDLWGDTPEWRTAYNPLTMPPLPDLTEQARLYREAHGGTPASNLRALLDWVWSTYSESRPELLPDIYSLQQAFRSATGRDAMDVDEIWAWAMASEEPDAGPTNPLGIPPSLWDTLAPSAKVLIRDAYIAQGGTAEDFDWGIDLQRPGGRAGAAGVAQYAGRRSAF